MDSAEDWDELKSMWAEAEPAAPAFDVDGVRKKVRRAHLRRWGTLTLEVVCSVLALMLIVGRRETPVRPLLWVSLAIIPMCWGLALWARRGSWSTRWDSLEDLVDLAERQARAGLRHARAGYISTGFGTLLLAAAAVLERHDMDVPRALSFLGVAIYIALFGILNRRIERRRQRELDEAQALRMQLRPEPEA